MSIGRGLAVVATCGIVFGAAGAAIGLVLGKVAPGYYRAVFRNGLDPAFRPEEVGVGLGSTQGVVCGVVVGSVLVLALARAGHRSQDPEFAKPRSRPRWAWRLARALLLLLALAASGAIGFVAGAGNRNDAALSTVSGGTSRANSAGPRGPGVPDDRNFDILPGADRPARQRADRGRPGEAARTIAVSPWRR